jgi:acylphosphatase
MICRRFVVQGRVQGVFYRASTRDQATSLGLLGWVQNRNDGAVELVACGDIAQLSAIEAWLWQGPPSARVAKVDATVSEHAPSEFSSFDIRY